MSSQPISLRDLRYCFEGAVPSVVATASADRVPNVTYLTSVRMVDDERVALSNQFFSKTVRNLAENPRGSVLVIDPTDYRQYRLTLVYERTDRRGPVFERLREDVDLIASLEGMEDVFKLRAADIYRVIEIEAMATRPLRTDRPPRTSAPIDAVRVAELSARLSRCPDLDAVVTAAVNGLAELFGYDHSLLLLLDEEGTRLYTIASHGYPTEGVGSEVLVGDGMIGLAAERCRPITVGNLGNAHKYSKTVRRGYEAAGEVGPGQEIPVPGLPGAWSRVAVPAVVLGELVGVLVVESREPVAFDGNDEAVLTIVASYVGNAIEVERSRERSAEVAVPAAAGPTGDENHEAGRATRVRFFPVDGSTFVDGDYLIKGVAGRILWALLGHHATEGRTDFTNREIRLDPTLELPELRDNFESRLILLKRRLDERAAPIRIEKTGRGRFRLDVHGPVVLDAGH